MSPGLGCITTISVPEVDAVLHTTVQGFTDEAHQLPQRYEHAALGRKPLA